MSVLAAQIEAGQPNQKALVPQPEELPRTEKQISLYYGERSEIRELIDRMRAGLPNAGNIPDSGIRALATAAYAHDLDPWNGEIWVIYNERKNETSLMAGVKGLRKAAKRQLTPGHFYYPNFRPIHPEDFHLYGLEAADEYGREVELAEICELRRGDACAEYTKTLRQLFDMCGSFQEARDMLGPMPVYVGVGVVRKGEKSKMERCQLVKKRAESDALKRAFDLPFSDRVNGNGGSVTVGNAEEDAIEGEYQVANGAPKDELPKGHSDPAGDNLPAPAGVKEAPPEAKTEPEKKLAEPEPAPEPQPEPPAAEKSAVSAQAAPAAPIGGKIATDQAANSTSKPKFEPEPRKAEEKPAEPVEDSGEDINILALKRSHPASWVTAAEMLNKTLGTDFIAGKLREAAAKKLGKKDFEALSPADGWPTAIEVALDAAAAIEAKGK